MTQTKKTINKKVGNRTAIGFEYNTIGAHIFFFIIKDAVKASIFNFSTQTWLKATVQQLS